MPRLIAVMNAAEYLQIEALINLTCATMASRIQRHTPQQIRRILGLETDSSSDNDIDLDDVNNWY